MCSRCQEEFCVPAGPGASPVHVDGEAVAALSRFLAVFGGWLSTGLDNGFSTRCSTRQCPEPGYSSVGIWMLWLAEAAALQIL